MEPSAAAPDPGPRPAVASHGRRQRANGSRSAAAQETRKPATGSTAEARSIALCRGFCEELVAEAQVAVGEFAAPGPAPPVDWERVWDVRPGTPLAAAAGRAVLASSQIASTLLDQLGHEAPVAVPFTPTAPSVLTSPPRGAPPATDDRNRLMSARQQRRLRAVFVAFGWVRNVGLILLLFAAWQLWGTSIEHAQAQSSLRQQFHPRVHQPVTTSHGPALVPLAATLPEPGEGSAVARLQIPAIGVDQIVVEGTAEGDLAKGPGHYVGTAMPGQAGNVAIAGHRTTYGAPFGNLDRLAIGDHVELTTDAGEVLTYVVSQPPVAVSPRDVSLLNTVGDDRLTLTTCNPKFSASQRLVVVALLDRPVTPGSTSTAPMVGRRVVHVVDNATGWNLGYLPLAVLLLAVLVLLGLANQRARHFYGRTGRWLVLVPIWSAGLYFLFVALTKLLPANL